MNKIEIEKTATKTLEARKQANLQIRQKAYKKASRFIKSAINILKNNNMDLDIVQNLETIYNNFKLQDR